MGLLTNLIEQDQEHKRSQKDAQANLYLSAIKGGQLSPGPNDTPEQIATKRQQLDYALDQYGKLSGASKEHKNLLTQMVGGAYDKIHGAGQKKGGPLAPPQGVSQASAQPAQGAAPKQGNTDDPGAPGQPATPPAAPQTGAPLQTPREPLAKPAFASGDFAQAAFPNPQIATDAANKTAKENETFKTDEQIRGKKQEEDNASQQARDERDKFLKEIEADPKMSDDDKKAARLKAYGVTTQQAASLQDTHVQLKDGTWVPAQHDPKTGQFKGVDQKPIDPSTIQDVRPEPPAPEKDSQEVRDLTEANLVSGKFKGSDGKPDKTAARNAALAQRKKQLDDSAKKTQIQITNASNQGGGGANAMTDDELRATAQREIQTGAKPSFGMGKSPERSRYNKVLAQMWAQDPDAAAARQEYKAGGANLQGLEKMKGQIGAFEDAFKSDLDLAREASTKVPRSQSKKWNSFQQMIQSDLSDYPELAQFSVAAQTAVNQYSRLVSSASAGGVSTDSARREAISLLDKSMAAGSFNAALDQMEKEAGNRVKGIEDEISKAKTGMRRPSPKNALSDPRNPPPKTADQYLQSLGR